MKKSGLLIMTILMIAAASAVTYGQTVRRIRFARGATSAVVTGHLAGYRGKIVYLIRVRRGQTLRTVQIGSSHPVTVSVTGPTGDFADSDASCNNRKEISPTTAGDYRIEVVECRKADPWQGRFRIRVSVL
ncbi:MAG: hypothetical protein ABI791_02490 [Acidobacteriota bacterium]